MFEKAWKHFKLVTKHRWIVYKLCSMAGIKYRGLIHDLSKYSPFEFFESVKYYNGEKSPIQISREKRQYSKAWLHHKGKNKHHEEYWYDWNAPIKAPIIPYKYLIEMLCDNISAGLVYKGENWTKEYPLHYWGNHKNKELFHPKIIDFFDRIYKDISIYGVDKVITKENLQEKYKTFVLNGGI